MGYCNYAMPLYDFIPFLHQLEGISNHLQISYYARIDPRARVLPLGCD